ncbi:MAG TPA: E3 binding domain-containing protein [Rubrobacter sp.]|nr:E3 binding domain-containing protein [Rubrobacter sp.]
MESDRRTNQEEEYAASATEDRGESRGDPDVLLDVSKLDVEEIDLEVEDLQVRVAFLAELADLVKINVGLDAEVNEVKLQIKGVEAQAQLKARLDNVRAIFSEVLSSLQHSPQFFRQALGTANETTETPEQTPWDTGSEDEIADTSAPSDDGEVPAEPEATEAARKKARDLRIDLSSVEGTGSDGRILVRDVTKAAKR